MSRDYAESRIREALKLTKGNPTKARQQVIAWAVEDQRLLLGLTQPHLTGVVAHAINRVIYREGLEQEPEEILPTPKSLDMGPETFGKQILNALAGKSRKSLLRPEEAAVHQFVLIEPDRELRATPHQAELTVSAGQWGRIDQGPGNHGRPSGWLQVRGRGRRSANGRVTAFSSWRRRSRSNCRGRPG